MPTLPQVLPIRQQAEVVRRVLRQRLETILPAAMREAGIDCWLIPCQEDDYDPVFQTLIPMDTWAPILQMLLFFDRGTDAGIERINLSLTDLGDLYDRPWRGVNFPEQWQLLAQIIADRNPQRIGLNIGSVQWAAGGLTHNLYGQLLAALPEVYHPRLVSAESAATRWLMTLSEAELELYPAVARLAHAVIQRCFSSQAITPGVTTSADLEWLYWQTCADLGLGMAFKPFFRLIRSQADQAVHPLGNLVIHPGDVLHCDVGLRYLRLNSDHQELAYVLRPGESEPPAGLQNILAENNRLQQVFMDGFKPGQTGDQMLAAMLARARSVGIPNPKIYSHSLGLFLHEPGPLIGLPWEQGSNPGRGDVALVQNSCFTMELSVEAPVPEWGGQAVRLGTEQDVLFTAQGCQSVDGVQTEFHLV